MSRKLCVAGAVIGACAAVASGAQGMTLRFGTPKLTAGVLIREPVGVTCSPFDPSLTLFQESVSVNVEEAAGRAIASGSGTNASFYPTLIFPCDGRRHVIVVDVLANISGPPFHAGRAVFTASGSAEAGTPLDGGFQPVANQAASIPPVARKLP